MNTAKLLTDLAEKVKTPGCESATILTREIFKPLADRIPWEVLFTAAGSNVVMQLDIGNCLDGGGNPVAVLQKFPHRCATIHLKEHGGPKGAVIGEGDVPGKRSSRSAKPRPAPSGILSSRRLSATRRWKASNSVWRTFARWGN